MNESKIGHFKIIEHIKIGHFKKEHVMRIRTKRERETEILRFLGISKKYAYAIT